MGSEYAMTWRQMRHLWGLIPPGWGWRRRVRFWLIAWLVREDTVMIHARLEHVARPDAEIIQPVCPDAKVFALRNHFTGPSRRSPEASYAECWWVPEAEAPPGG